MRATPLVPFPVLTLCGAIAAQAHWLPVAPGTPDGPPSITHAMAPDPLAGVLLFGGHPSNTNYTGSDRLWRWHGGAWTELTSLHRPPGRRGPMMALDTLRGRVVMHGGFLHTDTWEWNGVDWTQVLTAAFPDARTGAAFCFDSARDRCVLYGGLLGSTYSDTWEYDGANWVQRASSWPPLQERPAMAFDRRRGRSVMLAKGVNQTNTWEWDGSGWIYRTTLPVHAPYGGLATYDEVRARIVYLTNGAYQQPVGGDTWEWDGAAWLQRGSDPALARTGAALVADRSAGAVWLYGGQDTVASTTQLTIREYRSAPNADYAPFGAGCGPGGAPTLQVLDWPWLGDTMRVRIAGPAGLAGVLNTGFDTSSHQGIPLPLPLGPLGFPGCTALVGPEVAQAVLLPAGEATFVWPVPNDSGLLGVTFAQQVLLVQGNALWASAGARATLGRR